MQVVPFLYVTITRRSFLANSAATTAGLTARPFITPRARWRADEALAEGGTIEVPAGTHVVRARRLRVPVRADHPFSLVGPGSAAATLLWKQGGGILAIGDSPSAAVNIQGVGFVTQDRGEGTAISCLLPEVGSSTHKNVTMNDVDIRGSSGGWWTGGAYLANCWQSTITDVTISGKPGTTRQRFGFKFSGQSTSPTLTGVRCHYTREGVRVTGNTEGVRVLHSDFVGQQVGIRADKSDHLSPLVFIDDVHINSSRVGVLLDRRAQGWIRDSLLYRLTYDDHAYVGVDAFGSDIRVTGTSVFGIRAHSNLQRSIGIRLKGLGHSAEGCTVDNMTVGVEITRGGRVESGTFRNVSRGIVHV